jgi:hypothetical protein
MKIAFKNAEIYDMAKITHQHTMAIQYGASRGLNSTQISSCTKHRTDKLHNCFMPGSDLVAMKVMSGFRIHETRYVESEHITFPDGFIDHAITQLSPDYGKYCAQLDTVPANK